MALKKLIYGAFIWKSLNYVSVFLLNILTARLLGASVSGEVYYVITFFSLIVLFASLNLESGLNYFSLTQEIPVHQLISTAVSWLLIFAALFFFSYDFFSVTSQQTNLKTYSLVFVVGMLLTDRKSVV